MKIVLLKHDAIDCKAYTRCIENSLQEVIYALPWYLDTVSPGWQLLASEDYSYVMPLPCKKKFGFSYAIQPPLCQQLGIFSKEAISEEILQAFIRRLPYSYSILHLNAGNLLENPLFKTVPNYILPLTSSYEEIYGKYAENCRYSLKVSIKREWTLDEKLDIDTFLQFTAQHSPYYRPLIALMKDLAEETLKRQVAMIWGIRSSENTLLAMALLLRWKNRIYYLASITSEAGKKQESMRVLIDQLIRRHCGSDMIFDFEGSSIPSVAQFYRSFGSVLEPYALYKQKEAWVSVFFPIIKMLKLT